MCASMNRRSFVARSSLVLAAGLLSRSWLPGQAPAAPTAGFHRLRRNVGYFTGRGGTIGWLSNSEALAAIDTQFPDSAAAFLAGLPGRNDRMLDLVVNTHHHGDHTGGNPTLRPATRRIMGHENVPELMRAAGRRGNANATEPVVPDTTFAERWSDELGDEVITARYFGPAHTRGDIVTHLERANVIHMGDLMFNRVYPVIDRPGGASVRGWVSVLEKVVAEYPADAIYIFGHAQANSPQFGVHGARGDLLVFRDYLTALLAHVEKELAAGKSRDEVIALQNLPGFPDYHVERGSRLPGNLGVVYDELTESRQPAD